MYVHVFVDNIVKFKKEKKKDIPAVFPDFIVPAVDINVVLFI